MLKENPGVTELRDFPEGILLIVLDPEAANAGVFTRERENGWHPRGFHQEKKDDWVAAVDRLYSLLTEDLLKKLIYDEHIVEAERVPTEITEEYVGTYSLFQTSS